MRRETVAEISRTRAILDDLRERELHAVAKMARYFAATVFSFARIFLIA